MGYISLTKRNRFGDVKNETGVNLETLKSTLLGGSLYSTESASVLEALSAGSFEASDMTTLASQLLPSLGEESLESLKNPAGVAAATMLSSIAARPGDYMRLLCTESKKLSAGVPVAFADGMDFDNVYSAESFDNQNLQEYMGISIGLTYKLARQQPAMELVYRTIPMTPDMSCLEIEVPNLYVQNLVRHAADGSESDFGLRRVIDSSIDYKVLHENALQLIPGYSVGAAANFVDTALVTPFVYKSGKREVTTSALTVGKNINLFGLGQSDTVARVGQPDYTEALDRNIGIASVYLNIGSDTIYFDTDGLPFSRFYKAPEQNGRAMKLDFPLTSLIIDGTTKQYDGDALADPIFATIASGGYKVRLRTVLNGTSDVERGFVNINPGVVEVMSITNEAGEAISLTTGAGATIVAGLANLKIVGWWPAARLTNSNHRHLGQMLNVRSVKERFMTRVRTPFFVPYPIAETRDETIMDWLTFTVGQYMNNEGVGALIGYHERLMRLTGGLRGELTSGDFELNSLPLEGIARYLINPYVQTAQVDLAADTQSTATVGNIENANEVLLNNLRSIAFDILQKTGYENACRYMDGGEITKKWKFALVTSPRIQRFMTVKGDSRSLGAELPYEVESDLDARLEGCIYMTIVREGEGVDILSSGIMTLTPTMVSQITVTRDGTPRQEAVYQPRFQHYNLLPVIVKIEVAGVEQLLEDSLAFKVDGLVTPAEPTP